MLIFDIALGEVVRWGRVFDNDFQPIHRPPKCFRCRLRQCLLGVNPFRSVFFAIHECFDPKITLNGTCGQQHLQGIKDVLIPFVLGNGGGAPRQNNPQNEERQQRKGLNSIDSSLHKWMHRLTTMAESGRTNTYTEAGLKFRFPVRVAEHLSPTTETRSGQTRGGRGRCAGAEPKNDPLRVKTTSK